jgi:hypothetical protein
MTTPDTIGPRHPAAAAGQDPRGWLVFSWFPSDLQNAEDSRAKADFDYRRYKPRGFERPATPAEVELLQWLNYDVPDGLVTKVSFATKGCRHRSWPALEQETP